MYIYIHIYMYVFDCQSGHTKAWMGYVLTLSGYVVIRVSGAFHKTILYTTKVPALVPTAATREKMEVHQHLHQDLRYFTDSYCIVLS